MKLNLAQIFAVLYILQEKYGKFKQDELYFLSKLFDGKCPELRIIYRYGMAGKLWNNNGRIYVTGPSKKEFGYSLEVDKEIKEVNSNIAKAIEVYKNET